MNDALRHRGPDDEGFALTDEKGSVRLLSGPESHPDIKARLQGIDTARETKTRLGLGHRRFSIIATDAQGHQPWVDTVSGNVLVFNGEIYNYIELREDLKGMGYGPFVTGSDTEVLAVAYRAWGTECFARFNGFWAVAVYDPRKRKLVLSRDRFGKKPLYLFRFRDGLLFSSEVRSIATGISGGLRGLTLETGAAFAYLVYDRRNTLFGSMWKEVQVLPASHWLMIDLISLREETSQYWRLPANRLSEEEISLPDAIAQVQEIFRRAVQIRLRADVPYCADLSGGIDSSTIVAGAQNILGKANQLTTNYIGYENSAALDESRSARKVAEFVQSRHNVVSIASSQCWDCFDRLVESFEEPVHSQAYMTQWMGWMAVRQSGYKVILHGAAGDELMAGYSYLSHLADQTAFNAGRLANLFEGQPFYKGRTWGRLAKWMFQGRLWPDISNPIRTAIGLPDRRRFMPDIRPRLERAVFQDEFLEASATTFNRLNDLMLSANRSLDSRMRADFEVLRIPFWVNAMDKSMMSIPVEVRMPFLDFELVEFMFKVPISYHYQKGWTKYLLRRAFDGMLPKDVLWRRGKVGFSVPKEEWYYKHGDTGRKILARNGDRLKPFVKSWVLTKNAHLPIDLYWRILNFARWLEMFDPRVEL